MGANNTGQDITIGEYNQAPSGTVLSMQPMPGNINFTTEALVVDATAPIQPTNAIRAQTNEGAAVLAINNASMSAAASATNSFAGGGVSGSCDLGVGVMGRSVSELGVFGASNSWAGVWGQSEQGPGVVGLVGTNGPAQSQAAGIGVYGFGQKSGVKGDSIDGFGVRAHSISDIGVFATSKHERAAVFLSGTPYEEEQPGIHTSQEGIAQVRLVPSLSPKLPTKGNIGDLFVHWVPKNQPPDAPVNLYLCVLGGVKPQWQQVQLVASKIYNGGDKAP